MSTFKLGESSDSYYYLWGSPKRPIGYANPPLWKIDGPGRYNSQNNRIWPLIIIGIITFLIWSEYGS